MSLEKIKDNTLPNKTWTKESRIPKILYKYYRSTVCREISRLSRFFDMLVEWCPHPNSSGYLFENSEKKHNYVIWNKTEDYLPLKDKNKTQLLLLNGNLNYWVDIQKELEELKTKINRNTRIIAIVYSYYAKWIFKLLNRLKLRSAILPRNYISLNSLSHIFKLSGYEMIYFKPLIFFPFRFVFIGDMLNLILKNIPIIKNLCFVGSIVLRPIITEKSEKSLSIIIPAKNERENITRFFAEITQIEKSNTEIIFVEGHSSDRTWNKIEELIKEYHGDLNIKLYKQPAKGKKDAVEYGFSKASGDLILILDSDLTVSVDEIKKFYNAYCEGLADFINGDRLVYPMEKNAMRFLNWIGNVFFAKVLSVCLNQKIGDSLCGTKLFPRVFLKPMKEWIRHFNKTDPFGDFELLFAASELCLGIVDVPVHYSSRKYGTTQIQRFYNGWQLIRMLVAFTLLKLFHR